jgi:hypothetical protein
MRDKDDIDLLLDSAVSSYAEPGPGFEQQILDRLAVERNAGRAPAEMRTPRHLAPHHRRWMPWAIALPLAACLIIFLILAHKPSSPSDIPQLARLPESALGTAETLRHLPPLHRRSRPSKASPPSLVTAKSQLPKLDVFPSPQPLNPQEHAWVDFVSHAPEPERKALLDASRRSDAPLAIAAIEIPPVPSPTQGAN